VDVRDIALAASFPVASVPKFGDFSPLKQSGQRLLVAGNGFFLEVRRSWLYAVQRCGLPVGGVRYPFGRVRQCVELSFGRLPSEQVRQFIAVAREHCPLEVAGVIVYSATGGLLQLRLCESEQAGLCRVRYRVPTLASDEDIVADIHSHGGAEAGFSATDDVDDAGATRFAIVVGEVDTSKPQVAVRLCLNGLFVTLDTKMQFDTEDR
jgi:PRTRC genetic system protein A